MWGMNVKNKGGPKMKNVKGKTKKVGEGGGNPKLLYILPGRAYM